MTLISKELTQVCGKSAACEALLWLFAGDTGSWIISPPPVTFASLAESSKRALILTNVFWLLVLAAYYATMRALLQRVHRYATIDCNVAADALPFRCMQLAGALADRGADVVGGSRLDLRGLAGLALAGWDAWNTRRCFEADIASWDRVEAAIGRGAPPPIKLPQGWRDALPVLLLELPHIVLTLWPLVRAAGTRVQLLGLEFEYNWVTIVLALTAAAFAAGNKRRKALEITISCLLQPTVSELFGTGWAQYVIAVEVAGIAWSELRDSEAREAFLLHVQHSLRKPTLMIHLLSWSLGIYSAHGLLQTHVITLVSYLLPDVDETLVWLFSLVLADQLFGKLMGRAVQGSPHGIALCLTLCVGRPDVTFTTFCSLAFYGFLAAVPLHTSIWAVAVGGTWLAAHIDAIGGGFVAPEALSVASASIRGFGTDATSQEPSSSQVTLGLIVGALANGWFVERARAAQYEQWSWTKEGDGIDPRLVDSHFQLVRCVTLVFYSMTGALVLSLLPPQSIWAWMGLLVLNVAAPVLVCFMALGAAPRDPPLTVPWLPLPMMMWMVLADDPLWRFPRILFACWAYFCSPKHLLYRVALSSPQHDPSVFREVAFFDPSAWPRDWIFGERALLRDPCSRSVASDADL